MSEENNEKEIDIPAVPGEILEPVEEVIDEAEIVAEAAGIDVDSDTAHAEKLERKAARPAPRAGARGPGGPGGKKRPNNNNRNKSRHEAEAVEYVEKVVQVRRVTKVVKGGKKLSFRTTVIIGNEKGKVGVGVGKASEVLIAIKKAISDARKNLVDIQTVANTNTISHTVVGKSGGAQVLLKPAADGAGIIAGGTTRIVLELAGVGDILSKSQGSKSPLNVARATVNALQSLRTFQEVASSRGLTVKKMLFA